METMNGLVPVIFFGSIFLFLILFAFLPPRRAVIASFLSAWLFLPVAEYQFDGIPEVNKLFITCVGIFLAVFVFDIKRLFRFRPNRYDIPMMIWCFIPYLTSIMNDVEVEKWGEAHGRSMQAVYTFRLYDGFSESLDQILLWGIPYILGRLYFTKWHHLKELAYGMLIAGVTYSPFIIFEMRFSPQLHNMLYGYHQHLFNQTQRFWGYRPMVFMHHGLMLAFFIMAVAVISVWMAYSGTLKEVKLPLRWYGFVAPMCTMGLLRDEVALSATVLALLFAIIYALLYDSLIRYTPKIMRWILFAIPVLPALLLQDQPNNYIYTAIFLLIALLLNIIFMRRHTQDWDIARWKYILIPFWIVPVFFVVLTILCVSVNAWLWMLLGLTVLFVTYHLKMPWIIVFLMALVPIYIFLQITGVFPEEWTLDFATGLFGSDRSQSLWYRYYNESLLKTVAREKWFFGWAGWDRQIFRSQWGGRAVPDSLWIIIFGKFGVAGLAGLIVTMFLPGIIFLTRFPPWMWRHKSVAPAAAMSVILILFMCDGLLNAMINPVYMLMAGGLIGTLSSIPNVMGSIANQSKKSTTSSPLQAVTTD